MNSHRETTVDGSRKKMADRVARSQVEQQAEPVYYATRTTNCCGCLEFDLAVFLVSFYLCSLLNLVK